MIFKKRIRHEYEWTDRKAQSFLDKPKRDLKKTIKKYPLFEPILEVKSSGVSLEEEKVKRNLAHQEFDNRIRNFHARTWREARKIYASCSEEVKQIIMNDWNSRIYPLESTYFMHLVDKYSGNLEARLLKIKAEDDAKKAQCQAQINIVFC